MLTVEQIAAICHDANRRLCIALSDHSQPVWEAAPDWAQSSAITGVSKIASGEITRPDQSHESWMAQKLAEGWTYGPEKKPDLKQHHCLVPYDQLPPEQQAKDHLFFAIATTLLGLKAPAATAGV